MRRFLLCCAAFTMSLLAVCAQEACDRSTQQGWFAGISCEMPFGTSTFSSFGSDKARAGWGAGAYVGHRFSAVTSAEISMTTGRADLAARECCVERGYWLGSDGIRYNAPVVDMEGWSYSELRSVVSLVRLDARVNVNLFGFFSGTKGGPWAVELSPAVSAACSKSDIKVLGSGVTAGKKAASWNPGAGARVQVRRTFGRDMEASAYSGFTFFAGERLDGVPVHQHDANMFWETGLRLGLRFGVCKGERQ
mgnify:FL=1